MHMPSIPHDELMPDVFAPQHVCQFDIPVEADVLLARNEDKLRVRVVHIDEPGVAEIGNVIDGIVEVAQIVIVSIEQAFDRE